MPAVATAALAPGASRVAGSWVCLATPVHLLAGMTSIGMAADGLLEIEPGEADALAADFNQVFAGGGVSLERGRVRCLLCRFDEPLRVTTRAPEEAAGHDLWGYLPTVRMPRAARLASEIEMWLFDHAVNRAALEMRNNLSSARSGCGAGAPPTPSGRRERLDGGRGSPVRLLGAHTALPGAATRASSWCPTGPARRRGTTSRRWLAPALGDLRAGRLASIELSARRRGSAERRALRRFWRRRGPGGRS